MREQEDVPGLMGYLLSLERGQLRELAERWDLADAEASAAAVYGEMTDPWALASVRERLPSRARLALDALAAAQRRGLTTAQLAEHLSLSVAATEGLCGRLFALGLAIRREQEGHTTVYVPDEVGTALAELARRRAEPDRSGATLEVLLGQLPLLELQRLAKRWGIADADLRLRRELLADLAKRLGTRETVRPVVANLSPLARRVLTRLVRAGGVLEAGELKRAMALGERELRAAARELIEVLLAREAFTAGRRTLVVPVGVGVGEERQPTRAAMRVTNGPPLAPERFALPWDLLTLLRFLQEASPPVVRLPLYPSQARRLAPLLQVANEGEDAARLGFLAALAQGLGLVDEEKGRLRPSPRAGEWEQLDFAAQTQAIYRWWLGTERWREGLAQSDRDTGGPLALGLGRERLVALLRECTPARWYDLDAFLGQVRQREPLLWREREAFAIAVGQGGLERAARYWERWDGRVARGALTLSLRWMGALQLHRRADKDNALSFALTPLGAWLVGREGATPPEWPGEPSLAARGAGEVALRWPDGPTAALLSRYANPVVSGDETVYRLDAQSVARAVAGGADVEALLALLRRHGALAPPLAAAIRDWAAAVKPLRAYRGLLLEAQTPAALDALLASPRYAALRLRRLAPTVALVGDEQAFTRAIGRLCRDGYDLGDSPGAGSSV